MKGKHRGNSHKQYQDNYWNTPWSCARRLGFYNEVDRSSSDSKSKTYKGYYENKEFEKVSFLALTYVTKLPKPAKSSPINKILPMFRFLMSWLNSNITTRFGNGLLVGAVGLEPTTNQLWADCSNHWATPPKYNWLTDVSITEERRKMRACSYFMSTDGYIGNITDVYQIRR